MYVCMYVFIWLCWVLVAALGSFDPCCSMQDLHLQNAVSWHVGCSSLIRD